MLKWEKRIKELHEVGFSPGAIASTLYFESGLITDRASVEEFIESRPWASVYLSDDFKLYKGKEIKKEK
jgi:hypothetical protein